MIRNYLKIALRTLFKNKTFTVISLLGLAMGMCCFILLYLYVRHELSFDRFHENEGSLYRVVMCKHQSERADKSIEYETLLDPELFDLIKQSNLSISRASRYQETSRSWLEYGEKMKQDCIGYVDPEFMQMFTFPLIEGDEETALNEPDAIILNETLVRYFFGEQNGNYSNIIGKIITLPSSARKDFIVRGVMKDLPGNTIFRFSALAPYDTWREMGYSSSVFGSSHFYVQLNSWQQVASTESNIGYLLLNHYSGLIEKMQHEGTLSMQDDCLSCNLQPLSDIYLNSNIVGWYVKGGNIMYSYMLAALASLVLLIACINAITIQLGQAVVRAREVGIRKVVGARRSELMTQFFVEAGLLCFFAMVVAFLFAELLLPYFNDIARKELSISVFESLEMDFFLLGALMLTTLIIGGFPSLIMSRFSPLAVLKFQKPTQGSGLFTRGLVVGQFSITLILVFSTLVMHNQIQFIQNLDVGYDHEGIQVLALPSDMTVERKEVLKTRIQALPSVLNVGGSDRDFNSGVMRNSIENKYGEQVMVRVIRIDEDFLATMNIALLEGRNFRKDMTVSRSNSVLVNKTYAEQFYLDDPIGEKITPGGVSQIMGLVEDFHIDSVRMELEPLVLHMWPGVNSILFYYICYREGFHSDGMNAVQQIWKEFEPNRPMQLRYLDAILQEQYEEEKQWNSITTYASVIAILLSCMGIWGITAVAVARRTREIGIRKILGSSEMSIWGLFTRDLIRLFGWALMVAIPLGWYTMQRWLSLFAYHIKISWWTFFQASLFCIFIALLTVSWLVIRAAVNNPVESLRYE